MLELQFTGQDAAFQVVVNGEISHLIQKEQLISLDEIDILDIKPYGQKLYDLLFPDTSRAHTTLKSITPLHTERICLVVGESPLLNAIPWEYLFDGTYYLAARHHLLRVLPQDKRREWQASGNHLNLYALLSNPALSENEPIAVKKAWDDLISVVRSKQGIHLRRVEPPTMQNLREHLQPNGVNLVHFLCHGGVDQEAVLALQNTYGQEELVPASRVIESVRNKASLVILNACMSATVGNNPLSNLAYVLVEQAVPYAIGMQFVMTESAAFMLSKTLYGELLKGYSIEEAVRQARNSLLDTSELEGREFWAGVPVLYTAVKDTPPPLTLDTAEAQITPAPDWIAQRQHLTELAAADRLVGRGGKIVEVSKQLQKEQDRRARFITLHGVGGVGKTSLAANVAQYNAWAFDYQVFGVSLEVLPNSQSFVYRLISFYLEEEITATWDAEKRQSELIKKVKSTTSLLILDNLETVLDAVDNNNVEAQKIVSIILNLAGGATAILLTTRVITHWQDEVIIELGGLTDDDGGKLFKSLLKRRKSAISNEQARQISHRLGGHPLSLRLTASEFERDSQSFEAFHQELEEILIAAEDREIKNLRDPERQKTLIGCIDYSVKKLPENLKAALRDLSLFLNPFLPDMASHVLQQEDATPVLRELHDRALLEYRQEALELEDDKISVLNFYSLHPTVRWFASWDMPTPDASVTLRYAEVFEAFLKSTRENYWGDKHLRLIFNTALDDFKQAGYHLQQRDKGSYLLCMGDVHRLKREYDEALRLYGEALILRTVDDKREVAVTLSSMGDVHRLKREYDEALRLYEEALKILWKVDDKREVAVTLHSMGNVCRDRHEYDEALRLHEEALEILLMVDDKRSMAVTLTSMGDVHRARREFAEALRLYGEALEIKRIVSDKRSVALMLLVIGDVHRARREYDKALELYGEVWEILRTVDDKHSVALTLSSMGHVYRERWEYDKALELYKKALKILRTVNDKREEALTLHSKGEVHRERGEFTEALELYGEALATLQMVDDKHSVALTLHSKGEVHRERGEFAEALELYKESLEIKRTVDDKREVAVTLGMMSQVYWKQAQYHTAIDTLWQAFQSIIQVDDPHTTQAMAKILQDYKSRLGNEQFDVFWKQMTDKSQPRWLQNITDDIFQIIIGRTYSVLTTHADQKSAWRQDLINVKGQATAQNDNEMMTFCDALIALLDAEGQFDGITTAFEGRYLAAWEQLKSRLTQKDDE